jgi:hypothetical protein
VGSAAQVLESAISIIDTLCERALRGESGGDALRLIRLLSGSALAMGALDGPAMCEAVVGLYRALWTALLQDPDALDAVAATARAWPPTVADVAETFASIGTGGDPHVSNAVARQWTRSVGDDPRLARHLVHLVGEAVRRVLFSHREERVAQAFGPEWAAALMPSSPSLLGGCDPRRRYYILHAGTDQIDAALLFVIDPEGTVSLVDSAITTPGRPRTEYETYDAARVNPERGRDAQEVTPEALGRFVDMTVEDLTPMRLFLACLAQTTPFDPTIGDTEEESFDIEWLDPLLLMPLPAGAQQVLDAMTDIDDERGNPMPQRVRDFIENVIESTPPRAGATRPELDLIDDAIEGVLLDECQLVGALQLFAGQIRARAAIPKVEPRPQTATLRDLAVAAYRGPLTSRLIPREILEPAALNAWATTCAGRAPPSGRLPGADRLLDVASLWGVPTRNAHLVRPELLCDALADVADVRIS